MKDQISKCSSNGTMQKNALEHATLTNGSLHWAKDS
jgi:hypothetical protein